MGKKRIYVMALHGRKPEKKLLLEDVRPRKFSYKNPNKVSPLMKQFAQNNAFDVTQANVGAQLLQDVESEANDTIEYPFLTREGGHHLTRGQEHILDQRVLLRTAEQQLRDTRDARNRSQNVEGMIENHFGWMEHFHNLLEETRGQMWKIGDGNNDADEEFLALLTLLKEWTRWVIWFRQNKELERPKWLTKNFIEAVMALSLQPLRMRPRKFYFLLMNIPFFNPRSSKRFHKNIKHKPFATLMSDSMVKSIASEAQETLQQHWNETTPISFGRVRTRKMPWNDGNVNKFRLGYDPARMNRGSLLDLSQDFYH